MLHATASAQIEPSSHRNAVLHVLQNRLGKEAAETLLSKQASTFGMLTPGSLESALQELDQLIGEETSNLWLKTYLRSFVGLSDLRVLHAAVQLGEALQNRDEAIQLIRRHPKAFLQWDDTRFGARMYWLSEQLLTPDQIAQAVRENLELFSIISDESFQSQMALSLPRSWFEGCAAWLKRVVTPKPTTRLFPTSPGATPGGHLEPQ
jgi:hypothetical protein